MNNLTYGIHLPDNGRIQLPYDFYSEWVHFLVSGHVWHDKQSPRFKTGDLKLSVWLEHLIEGEKQKVSAFDSIVAVVEPELSIFDFKLYVMHLL